MLNELDFEGTERSMVDGCKDFAGEYFQKIHYEYEGQNKTYEVEHFNNSDARVSYLIVDDKVVACVFERRTAFNHIEVMYSRKPII